MDAEIRNQIISELYDCYKANGFITEDEALSLFSAYNVPLHYIDSITEHLLTMGVIIQDADEVDDLYVDRSKLDYNDIFNEVVELAPELEYFVEYVRNITPPQHREWQKLIPQAQNGNEYAKKRLIEMYLKVVVRQALYSSKKHHLPLEDAIQDGLIGAITAVDKYNPADHDKFSTYVPWWVTQSISRNRWLCNNPTYFPVHIKDKLFAIMEEVEEHICEYCPDDERGLICNQLIKNISDKYEWSTEETIRNIQYLSCWTSLDEIVENDEELCDEGIFFNGLFDAIDDDMTSALLMKLLNELDGRLKEVILWRYGFTDIGVLTLEEIGGKMDLTRERVRQLEAKALRKLRVMISKKNPELKLFRNVEGSKLKS